jgi:hypothetical protein
MTSPRTKSKNKENENRETQRQQTHNTQSKTQPRTKKKNNTTKNKLQNMSYRMAIGSNLGTSMTKFVSIEKHVKELAAVYNSITRGNETMKDLQA